MDEWDSLLRSCDRKVTVGSNPTPSAKKARIIRRMDEDDRNYMGWEVLVWSDGAYLTVAECGQDWNLAWRIAQLCSATMQLTNRELQ